MKTKPLMKNLALLALLALAALALVVVPQPAAAGNWSVNTVAKLVGAINAANQVGGANTITLAPGMTFTLTAVNNTTDGPTGLPVVAANNKLTIRGNGATIARSKAPGTPAFRLFDVASGAALALENLTIANGSVVGDTGQDAGGGAILNAAGASLTVKCSVLCGNQAVGGDGAGGLGGLGFGGAVWNDGTASFDYVIFRGNQATGGASTNPDGTGMGGLAFGGAISSQNQGTLAVRSCWFIGNKAIGGLRRSPSAQFDGMGSSGAIDNWNTALVTDSTFTGNQGVGGPADPGVDGGYGLSGAIASGSPYASTTVMSILRCTFIHNQAIGADADPDSLGGLGIDGAVGNGFTQVASTLTIAHCAFTDNQAIGGSGGIGGWGQWGAVGSESPFLDSGFSSTVTIANCMFANNKALGSGAGGAGAGGAVGNADYHADDGSAASLAISDCTFTGNEARGDAGDGGASPVPELVQRAVANGAGPWSIGQSGAVDTSGNTKILRCTFRDNRAIGSTLLPGITPSLDTVSAGGGLGNWAGTLEVRDSSFLGNQVIGSTGSTGNAGIPSSGGGVAMGGGITILSGLTATILNCRFSDNAVTGGAGGGGAPGGAGVGGGLSVGVNPYLGFYDIGPSSAVTIGGTTISRNQAIGGAGGGAGMGGGYAVGTGVLFGIPDTSSVTLNGGSVVKHNQPDNAFQF